MDPPDEKKFLDRVRHEAELDVYDVTVDLREMCMQVSIRHEEWQWEAWYMRLMSF